MTTFDKGPTQRIARAFARVPDYSVHHERFWLDWGPIFYRGRLNGRVRLLCVASDPGPSERIAGRSLVGDAGQRVQGFLSKLGLTHSYLCLNAFVYALHPSHFFSAFAILEEPEQKAWRNPLFDILTSPELQAIVAFGALAKRAVDLWDARPAVPVFNVPHPSARNERELLAAWHEAISGLRAVVTPDPGGDPTGANYGERFTEADYAPIPRHDLPFGLPAWFGDDSWGRRAKPKHNNSVRRPVPDDEHTLIWIAPTLADKPRQL
jgi:uracil-DNA glycosylase